MTNILYIAYQFPPLNVGGSARPARFVKHLSKFDINTTVVTLDPESYSNVYPHAKSDSNLLDDYKIDFSILKVPSKNLVERRANKVSNFIDIFFNKYKGNEHTYWQEDYHSIVDKWLETNSVEAIVVTAPPFSILPLAVATSKKHNIPLVVDLRDHWTLWVMAPYGTYYKYLASKVAENKVFRHAKKIIVTSKVTQQDLIDFHPNIAAHKFKYIPNGFETPIVYKDITFKPSEEIVIGYVGSFYYSPESRDLIMTPWWKKKAHRKLQYVPRKEDWLYRSPYFLFKNLDALFLTYPELKHIIKVKFAGTRPDWFDEMVSEFGLENNVEHLGWISQTESLAFQDSCDFLLATSAKVIGGRDYSIAGKTFEYFRMQKPILALVAEGAQKDMLEQSGMAHLIAIDNTTLAKEQLHTVFTSEHTLHPNKTFIDSFQIEKLTEALANEIKALE
ncbi:glycosyltransferase family 4 protein [Subsaximicrobium wynnwilliamsii]|uniref:Glycosyltransferase family 4 protein n=1 Tax=Subsaximicrobium wynnwilliamsii TaxID=291179 RepID=A0A5C6ZGM1_9FLAO|nr:glycosyltransferase [Subsaximicrobium wynnwilliamsii]TXD81364.1 glycosyltransferase family 4 protein [Subsaximicrobium wynnwilliamsii]TXD89060.1 glycosyltransferase family 4 protein [Subsaximicrobium wynnwilliamsii]TXE00738.1 glycosyltransferase family 4 protein [Subsaximicrobium wynnwilliamsii]